MSSAPQTTEHFLALRTHRHGERIESRLERISVAELSQGEVVIRVRYAGVNYKDCLAVLGAAKIIGEFPRIAGIECVGSVVSSADAKFKPGDAVIVHGFKTGIAFDGGFAQFLRAPGEHVMHVPDGLSMHDAAVLGVPGFTVGLALQKFESLGLRPGLGEIAVSGAAGAVGIMAIAILSRAGYQVAAITRRADHGSALRQLGATDIVDAAAAVASKRPLESARFAAAIDNTGGDLLAWLLRSLRKDGMLASVGNASNNAFAGSVLPFIMRRIHMFGIVADADWPVRHDIWSRLSHQWRPDMAALAPHVHMVDLEHLLDHVTHRLRGEGPGGRILVDFGPASGAAEC
ncbi:acryloyl-CoA reductase [Allopusillimonas soli]|uniref:YhdH/YhfP family quinone oxidoreductase n=2 Tax=Allopusillimonas soli TaxID=659016 RepID=A0A853FCB8_9BURK|nr:YhdH/YhfP family quinone oxidoreductase [Allopusillimonas soli]TEA72229.1 acryloyl-CoA reductase [Allopusillimonas soli]